MKQHEAVIEALRKAGGVAALGDLYQKARNIPNCSWVGTKTPCESIRRIVRTRKEIFRIRPGLYGLTNMKADLAERGFVENAEYVRSPEQRRIQHNFCQGMLLEWGRLRGYETFCPDQDKNHPYHNRKLKDVRTLRRIPSFTHEAIVKKAGTVDVLWFNQRKMPAKFIEVEMTTNILVSLAKFCELQDFHADMWIIAPEYRKMEFENKISMESFRDIAKRVRFHSTDTVTRLYNDEVFRTKVGATA